MGGHLWCKSRILSHIDFERKAQGALLTELALQKDGLNFQKDPAWLAVVSPKDGQTGVSMAPPETHSGQRNALGATFTNEALLTQKDILQLHIDRLMEVLKTHATEKKAIEFSSWCKLSPRRSLARRAEATD